MKLIIRILAAVLVIQTLAAQPLAQFDFTKPEVAREWRNPHHISALEPKPDGLEITINGDDPYFFGPPRDYPTNTPLLLIIRLKSDEGGTGEIFYFRDRTDAQHAVKFGVPAGSWTEARVPLPALGPKYRLRFDPPGTGGKTLLASIQIEKRLILPPPSWPAWTPPAHANLRGLATGPLELWFSSKTAFGVELRVDGQSVAFGHPQPRIGYLDN